MTEEELKIKFDHIQGIFNRCINHASQVMIDNIAGKSSVSCPLKPSDSAPLKHSTMPP